MSLNATASDVDSDLDEVRWRIDGVLLEPTLLDFVPTGAHTMEVFARDERGATTTVRKEIECQ